MQSASNQRNRNLHRPVRARRIIQGDWAYSPITGLILAAVLLLLVGAATVYLAWDYMPETVQYYGRRLQSEFLPARPHPEGVPTPATTLSPEETLAQMGIAPAPSTTEQGEAPAASVVEEPAGESASEQETTAGAPATTDELATDAPAEAQPEAPAAEVAAEQPAETTAEAPAEVVAPPAEAVVPAPAPIHTLPGAIAELTGVRHEYQGWNNCGPATLAMNLSYFGRAETQNETAPFLKPDKDDKNVSPGEMAAYAHSIGYGAQVVQGGDVEFLKTLVANGLPVIVESWYIPDPNDEMGHYYLLTGYNGETLTFQDSYHGPNVQEAAAAFDEHWKVFNRTAVVIWPPEKADLAASILGERADEQKMFQQALAVAQAEVSANPQDKFAWFNLGTSLTALGDPAGAVQAFDTARSLGLPWRMLWYQFGPFQAYYDNGQYQEVIGLTTATLEGAGGNLEESYYWRGRAQAALGQTDAARSDFQEAVRHNPSFAPAQHALSELP